MENASKALIIAGAVLISILLVSLGILMFNSSKRTTDQAGATGDLLKNQVGKTNDSIREQLGLGEEISFTILVDGTHKVFTAEKGMTWRDFYDSSYSKNVGTDEGFYWLDNDTIGYYTTNSTGAISSKSGYSPQLENYEIEPGGEYKT